MGKRNILKNRRIFRKYFNVERGRFERYCFNKMRVVLFEKEEILNINKKVYLNLKIYIFYIFILFIYMILNIYV